MEEQNAYVYILASGFKKLYIGVTTELEIRVGQHKRKIHPESHTSRYNITQFVYFERFVEITAAIAREKKLKGWLRVRKIELVVSMNPTWRDLSQDWGKAIGFYRDGEELGNGLRATKEDKYRGPSLRSG